TSFVAVEQFRVTLGGEPMRIHVPVELPDDWAPESDITRRLIVDAAGYESWPTEVDRQVAGERYYRYQLAVKQAEEVARNAGTSNGDLDGDGLADVADASAEWESKQDLLEQEIRQSVLDADFSVAFDMLDVAKLAVEARQDETDAALTERFRERIDTLEQLVRDEAQSYMQTEVPVELGMSVSKEQERVSNIEEVHARQIRELMDRAAELRKESRLGESIQVLDQVLVVEPDNEKAQWMRDTLEGLEQGVRDREKTRSPNAETPDLPIDNDLSGLLLHFDASKSNDPAEAPDGRLDDVEFEAEAPPVDRLGSQLSYGGTQVDPGAPTASLGLPFHRLDASDDVDAGVPILTGIPELKARYAARAAGDEDQHADAARGYALGTARAGGIGGGRFISGGSGASRRGDLRNAGGGGGGGGNTDLFEDQQSRSLLYNYLGRAPDSAQAQTRIGQSADVDLWTVVRGARSTPSQYISPSTTTLDTSLSSADGADDSPVFGVNSSFAYAYSHDDDKSIFGTSSEPDFPIAFALVGEAASPFVHEENAQDQMVYYAWSAPTSDVGSLVETRVEIRGSHESDSFGRFVDNQANDPTDSGVDSGDVFFVGERYDASDADSAGGSKTPVLGDIPAVSSLFSSEQIGKSTHAGARTRRVLPVRNLTSKEAQELIRELQAAKAQDPSVESSRTATTSSATARPSGVSPLAGVDRLSDATVGRDLLGYDSRPSGSGKSTATETHYADVSGKQASDVL
ncbi:MAG: hypothetical protein KDA33_14165, partial [Phycisphaerales bacterium]|nr:hypothetical protein [Phycisphaerales bacterium]